MNGTEVVPAESFDAWGIFSRGQVPPEFTSYQKFKPFLRKDFRRRCAYCRIPEFRWGTARNYAVEHFRPKSRFPHLRNQYSNLYYSCNRCNEFKGDRWPDQSILEKGIRLLDPCEDDTYRQHLLRQTSGILEPLTPSGDYTNHLLFLNRDDLVEFRLLSFRIDALTQQVQAATTMVEIAALRGELLSLLQTLDRKSL
ncbi:MAG: hypothetical protein HY820_11555 [Acidobacteria bacterium]|nr:hypothetical protein [Acidobacteriota bacterium]